MNVPVRLFAVARQLAGCDRVELDLPDGATVADLRRRLGERAPELAGLIAQMSIAVGTQYADDKDVIPPDTDVACIPPVSGG